MFIDRNVVRVRKERDMADPQMPNWLTLLNGGFVIFLMGAIGRLSAWFQSLRDTIVKHDRILQEIEPNARAIYTIQQDAAVLKARFDNLESDVNRILQGNEQVVSTVGHSLTVQENQAEKIDRVANSVTHLLTAHDDQARKTDRILKLLDGGDTSAKK